MFYVVIMCYIKKYVYGISGNELLFSIYKLLFKVVRKKLQFSAAVRWNSVNVF